MASAIDTAFANTRNGIGLLLTGEVTTPIEKAVTFWCGNRQSPELVQTFLHDPDVHEKINFLKPVMIITHGWLDDHTKNWIQNTAQDALENMDINVCVVWWGHLAT